MTKTFFTLCLLGISTSIYTQVQVDKPIQLTGADGSRSINYLEAPVAGTDAVNKDYVDAAVAAGGGGSGAPSMISNESGSAYTYSGAVSYCDNLSEGGYSDWRMPDDKELRYFTGMSGASSNYLWTMSRSSIDYSANQNYISVRLNDGSWRNGDEMVMPVDIKVQTPITYDTTPWNSVATISPATAGNWLKATQLSLSTRYGYCRIKYNFPNGTNAFSPMYSYTGSTLTNVMSWANTVTPILVTSIDLQCYSYNSSYGNYGTLSLNGFEIIPFQKDGATLYTRCVR